MINNAYELLVLNSVMLYMQKIPNKIFTLAYVLCFIFIFDVQGLDLQSATIIRVAQPLINSTIRDSAKLPGIASDIVYLPKGLAKLSMSVLPGQRLGRGIKDVSKGLATPINLVKGVVAIPVNVIKGIMPGKKNRRRR